MTACTTNDSDGIVGGFCYSLLGVYTLNVNGAKLVKLRNPWGAVEWSGSYSDSDGFWTKNPSAAT